jgi:hypothetical protein
MEKLLLLPDSDGYSSTDGTEVLRTELDGGAGRYRRDKLGANKMVNVRWTLDPYQYMYWRAFYNTTTKKGTLPFLLDLVSEDGSGPTEHTCQFMPGSVTLPSQQGLTYVQQATLEVTPLPANADLDESIVFVYEIFGTDAQSILAALEHLVNVAAPEALNA